VQKFEYGLDIMEIWTNFIRYDNDVAT